MTPAPAHVVLVQGTWLRGREADAMRRRLRDRYRLDAHRLLYRNHRASLEQNVAVLRDYLSHDLAGGNASACHLVGHGLGGIVILQLLQIDEALPPGRIVLLGTPLADAAAAARVAALDGADGAFAGSLQRLVQDWRFAGREVGAIAGTLDTHLGVLHPDLERPNDGAVAVRETRVPGLADHIELAAAHAELVTSREVIDQTVHFLKHGAFARRRQALRRELAG